MPTLWLKFPDEALFYRTFSAADKKRLEDIFSVSDGHSPWRRALALLRIPATDELLLFWHENVPYFNWSAMVRIVSGGAVAALPAENGGYRFQPDYTPRRIWALLVRQWRMARFMAKDPGGDALAESLALGLGLQSLILQLGADAGQLALWLARPEQAPSKYRRLLRQIQKVQMRRTALSPAWRELFPPPAGTESDDRPPLPDHFWDQPPATAAASQPSRPHGPEWQGMPVCTGRRTGLAVADMQDLPGDGTPLILVFRRARPETTEYFAHAAAVLFAEGGILSHACTVARERNLPAVTALGTDLIDYLRQRQRVWLSVDGGTGRVKVLDSAQENAPALRPTEERHG